MSDGSVASVSYVGEYSFSKPARDEIVLVAGLGVLGDVHAGVTVRHRSRVRADPSQPNLRQVHLIQGELFGEVGEQGFTVAPGELGENVTTRGVDLLGLPRGAVLRFGPPPASGRRRVAELDAAAPAAFGGPRVAEPEAASPADPVAASPVGSGRVGSAREVVAAARRVELTEEFERAVVALEAAVEREAWSDPRPAVVITGLRNPCGQIDGFQWGLLKKVAYKDDDGRFVRKAGVMGVVLCGGAVRPGDPFTVELPPLPHEALDRV